MNNLLTEIKRIHELMGVNEKFSGKFLLNETTIYGEIMTVIKTLLKKTTQELTEEESRYLKGIIDEFNSKYADEFGEINFEGKMTDNVRAGLTKLLNKSENETLDFFTNVIKKIESQNIGNKVLVITPKQALIDILNKKISLSFMNGEETSIMDFLKYIHQKGGVSNVDMPSEFLVGLKFELNNVKNITSIGDPWYNYINDVISQIEEELGEKTTTIPEVKSSFDEIKDVITPKKDTNIQDLVSSDQLNRQGETMDINIDLNNLDQLKKLLGEDPQDIILNIEKFEDLDGIWLITQHADSDVQFQKDMLDLFVKNQNTLTTKFPDKATQIKKGIAMLTDRVEVNSTTSVTGYRETGNLDFGEISNGVQEYGTQGGLYNGKWVPRTIELDGKKYFFETPEDLINDKKFLDKLNAKRKLVGLEPMEDYLKFMNELEGVTLDLKIKKYNLDAIDFILKNKTNIKKQIEESIRSVLYSDVSRIKTSDIDETFGGNPLIYDPSKAGQPGYDENGLELTFKDFILQEKPNFFKDLNRGKYKNLVDENNNWDLLNKLDTNTKDRKTLLEDWALFNGIDPKTMSNQQAKKLFDDFISECKNNPTKMKDFIQKSKTKYTTNITNNTQIGNSIEKSFLDKFQKGKELGNFEVVWKPQSEGNSLDKTGIDMIIKDDKGNFHFVQIKKSTNNLTIQKSSITGEPVIKGFTWTGIKLKNGFVGLQDAKGNWILFPPQNLYTKSTSSPSGYVPKLDDSGNQIKGFLSGLSSTHFIDITDKEGDEFFTNLDISNILPKK